MASIYDMGSLELNDEEVLADAGGKQMWSALTSALETNVSYEFVSDAPFEYIDFKQRYLIRRVDNQTGNAKAQSSQRK